MAFEGLSSRLQEIARKIKGKARITEKDLKEMLREVFQTEAKRYMREIWNFRNEEEQQKPQISG